MKSLSSGGRHTCGLSLDNTAACWGNDEYGQSLAPKTETFSAIRSGIWHTCGLRLSDGAPICWGNDGWEQASPPAGVRLTALGGGLDHTCAFAADGSPWCWGDGYEDCNVPVVGHRFSAIGSGEGFSCGLTTGGKVICWRRNWYGQSTPPTEHSYSVLSTGTFHTCALRKDQTPVCWGRHWSPLGSNPGLSLPRSDASTVVPSVTIKIEGSDFVLQVTKAVASDFERRNSDVETTVEFSYGIQGFIAGENDIANASAPMSGEEIATAVDNGVDYLELPVAKSVITIMVNERNDFVECLTVEQLADVWKPDSVVDSWNDLDDNWPDRQISLRGRTDRGVSGYFARALFGGDSLRSFGSIGSIENDRNALGYADYSYYLANSNDVELVGIDFGQGCVKPTKDTIRDGSYDLSIGPMFIYVSKSSPVTPLKREFAEFYMEHAPETAHEVGYVALNPQVYQRNLILLIGCIPSASPQTEDVDLEGIGLPNCSDLPLEAPPPVDTGLHPGLKNDREILLNMASALAGESTLNWSDHRRIREWEGLSFSGSPIRVTALELPQRGLTGNIPPELGGLTHLRGLHLGNNELTGNIPPELGKLGRLQSLVLPSNKADRGSST